VSNKHQEQAISSLSNTAIDVHGRRKIASYGLSRYKTKLMKIDEG
jgi:hypothetical protein